MDVGVAHGPLVLLVGGAGVVAQVANEANHVEEHEAADRPRGGDPDHRLAVGVEDEPGDLEEPTLGVDERSRSSRDGFCVGAVAEREGEAVLGHQFGGRRLVVGREGHHFGTDLEQAVRSSLKGPELGVAGEAPGAPVEQDHAETTG